MSLDFQNGFVYTNGMNRLQACEKRYAHLKQFWLTEKEKNLALLEALKKAIQGYKNLVELDILRGEYKTYTAEELLPELRQALAKAEGFTPDEDGE